jgi:hypothetical protein
VEDGGAVLPRIIEELVVALDIAAGEGLGDDIFGQRRGGEEAPHHFEAAGQAIEAVGVDGRDVAPKAFGHLLALQLGQTGPEWADCRLPPRGA